MTMKCGLQVFNSSGKATISLTSRITKYVGSITLSTANGSLTVPIDSAQYSLWFVITSKPKGPSPTIKLNGNVISWTGSGASNAVIDYGVY